MAENEATEPVEEGWFDKMCRETQEALNRVAPAPQAMLRLVPSPKGDR